MRLWAKEMSVNVNIDRKCESESADNPAGVITEHYDWQSEGSLGRYLFPRIPDISGQMVSIGSYICGVFRYMI